MIFGALESQKHRYVGGVTTKDDRFLIITGAESTSGNRLFYVDLTSEEQAVSTLQDTVEGDTYLIDNQDDTLIFYTNLMRQTARWLATTLNLNNGQRS